MLNDPVKRGEYLVTLGHCMVCHTPKGDAGLDMRQRGAFGHSFEGPWGVVVSRNITPHRDNGIGAWSDAEIKAAITQGKRPERDRPEATYALRAVCQHERSGPRRRRGLPAHDSRKAVMRAARRRGLASAAKSGQ